MIRHVELVVHELLNLVGGWMCALAMTSVVALAALAFLGLNLFKFDRESFAYVLRRLGGALSRGWGWMLVAGVLLLQLYGLSELRLGTVDRLAQEGQARYIAADDQGGLPTTQRAPQVAFEETTAQVQRIVLPAGVTNLEAVPGWNPEQARYGERPAVNVEDELLKEGAAIVLNRKTSVSRWAPTKLLRSDVDVRLSFLGRAQNQRRQAYQAEFSGRYTFANPFPEARRFHFSFPLPDNSGTLSGFKFKVDGTDVPAKDVDRGLDYELTLAPAQKVVVSVGYTHLGAQAWNYDVTGRREPIADFHLTVNAQKASDIKFLRGSLYPTRSEGGVLSWDLQNQITSQSIQLYFPFVPTEQLVRNLLVFTPLGVLGVVVLTVVWARLRRTGTTPWATCLVSLAACAGFCLTSYLLSYVPLVVALVLAGGATAWLQWQLLGGRLWVPVVAGGLAPLTFLAAGHTGLLLSVLAMGVLALTVRETVALRD